MCLELAAPQPYDAPGVFGFLAARAIEGVETAQLAPGGPLTYARTLALPGGPAAFEVTATPEPGHAAETPSRPAGGSPAAGGSVPWRLTTRLELADPSDEAAAVAVIRRLLDLDTDPAVIDAALAADPDLTPVVASAPGIRVPGASDAPELLLRAIVGQQIAVARATAHLSRLAGLLGSAYRSAFPGLTRLIPTPSQLVRGLPEPQRPLDPDRPLRLPARSIRTVRTVAAAFDAGELDIPTSGPAPDPAGSRARLTRIPGIGPWTAAYVTMRLLPDPDAWLLGDVAVLAGARRRGLVDSVLTGMPAHRALAERAERWAPWRSYATMHLWRTPGASHAPSGS